MKKAMRAASRLAFALLPALGLMSAGPAEAGLLGKTMDAVYYYPSTSSPYSRATFSPPTFVVGPGLDTTGDVEGVTQLLVDFTDSALTVTLHTVLSNPTWNSASFNGIIFTSPGPLDLAGANVDAATTMAGFGDSRISFSSNQIFVNWQGLDYNDGTVVKVDFAVPEPSSSAMLALGLAGLGFVSLWRRGWSASGKAIRHTSC